LATALPRGEFVSIPGRDHLTAPTAHALRDPALDFLRGDAFSRPI
jgi:hypothetical protein